MVLLETRTGIFHTTDQGNSWIMVRPQIANFVTTSLAVNSESKLLAGGDSGVYLSTDGGLNWTQPNSGLEDLAVRALMIAPSGYAFVGASRGGALRSVDRTTDVRQTRGGFPLRYDLSQNYPNPFNPTTKISFGVPKETRVRLQVFNLLGQLITTLLNENKSPGTYSVTWDASKMPSGLYFYRMEAGNFVQIRKALFLK